MFEGIGCMGTAGKRLCLGQNPGAKNREDAMGGGVGGGPPGL